MTLNDSQLVRVLKALADERRFRIVQEVAAAGEVSCGQLGDKLDIAQPTVSHHLKILMDAGLLVLRKDGQRHFLSVDRSLLDQLGKLVPARLSRRAAR
jgi:ArsR family transcriptional regulator